MADVAVTFLLENVKKLLLEHINLVSEAKKELNQLQYELELMKAFLKDFASKREKGEVSSQFERQIREVVYDVEDALDAYLTRAAAEKSLNKNLVGIFGIKTLRPRFMRGIKNLKANRLDLAKKIETIMEHDLQPIFERVKLGFTMLPSVVDEESKAQHHKEAPFLRQENVVGFEDEEYTLIKYLTEQSDELKVMSIIGMPGLGKTTLAWKIYRDPRIQYEFPTSIWVYVSQAFNMREVCLTILKKFTQFDMSDLTSPELAERVRSYLVKPKFLIILDDVWSCEAWKEIETVLPKNNKAGKVLITSRNAEVAWQANPHRIHKLRFLDSHESWELLQLEAFGRLGECPSDLEPLGRTIAKQCGGVPLAIAVIGGILVEKLSSFSYIKDEWEKVSTYVSTYLNYDKQKRTEKIISLSYNSLPHHLRDCFLYLGVFPEDTEVPTSKLIRLWIAEGFIKQNLERSLEEEAEDYLKDLVARNLVMVDKIKLQGDVKTCRLHSMIREFCLNEAAFVKKNLFQEVKKPRGGVFHPLISEIVKCRRLCIHSDVVDFLRKKPKGPRVRSFLCFSQNVIVLPHEYNQSISKAFNLLRVLDVIPIRFFRFPTNVTKLIHLRHIALSGENFRELPEAVSKLWNLQTIIIDSMSRTLEIKANIWKMMHLRHLKTKAAIILKREVKGGGGENLQTLSRLSTQCCTEDVFNKALNLKSLGIRGDLGTLVVATCLKKLDSLQKLKLVHDVFPHVTCQKPLLGLPPPDKFPPHLRILKLSSTFLDWKHMTALGKLHRLEVLKLKENAFMGAKWEAVGGSFPSLEFLHISHTDLEHWTASDDTLPKLKCLVLKKCEKLEKIPPVLKKSLQILDIEHVTESLVVSAREIEKGKQQTHGQQTAKWGEFKLIIAPGDA